MVTMMAMDTLVETVSVDELFNAVQEISSGDDTHAAFLKEHITEILFSEIPWSEIQYFAVLGKSEANCNDVLMQCGLGTGFYISKDQSWLLMIDPQEAERWPVMQKCGSKLKDMRIYNDNLCSLNLFFDTGLEQLMVMRCRRLPYITGLAMLRRLSRLTVGECTSLTILPGLRCMENLTTVNVSGCSELKELDFSCCGKLVDLDFSGCDMLGKLCLSGCKSLSALPDLSDLRKLRTLDLSHTAFAVLPDGIGKLGSLLHLDLSYMALQELPEFLLKIARRFYSGDECGQEYERSVTYDEMLVRLNKKRASGVDVALFHTTIEGVDMSIFEQPYKMILEWFENRELKNLQTLNEIKVVFLGDGEAGKSHTIARLMNDGGDPDFAVFDGQSTPGIVIRNKEYDLGDRKIQIHYWDFGGQEIMHSMHRIFLTGRTMYVILLNARDDTQSDRAKYWLHNVRSFAPDAPVLMVLNKIDQNENASVDERDLRSRYEKLTQVVRLSALTFDRETFTQCFTNALLDEIRKTGFLDAQWPISWTKVKNRLENMESHYIMGDDYQAICSECQVDKNRKDLLHWFNDLGISFCCDGENDYTLEDYVILRPDWITNALYIILFNRLEGARNGLIPHKSIYQILKNACKNSAIRCTLPEARYTLGDIDYVLRIMRKFNLSFTDGHDNEFIPMLCQQNSMVDIPYYQKDAEVLEFNMEFDYLPNNLLHRLMVERYGELDMSTVWRTGARFRLKELGYSAVVVIDGDTLRFFISHTDPMHRPNTYLTMLKAHVERIVADMGLQRPTCQLVYKLDGKRDEFDYEDVKLNRELGDTLITSKAHRKKILIEDILNQSAPDGLEDENKLLAAIRKSCCNIQAEPDYYLKNGENGRGMEDKRNRRIRDDLQILGYVVHDQTQRGLSGTGRGIGELDLQIFNDRKEPWTIIEALRVSSGTKTEWNKHLDKLVENYNYFGAPCLYLLTYVDSNVRDFQRIWEGYQLHIPRINPGMFTYRADSLVVLDNADCPQYVKAAKCEYDCGGRVTNAYHIFAWIPKQGDIIP